jgi:hypothetical protein
MAASMKGRSSCVEEIPARGWWWRRRGPGMAVATIMMGPGDYSVCTSRFLGCPTVVAFKGNEFLPSDCRPKAGAQFIWSSISSGSMWNRF